MVKTIALILAGGRGVRAGGGMPKQYRDVAGTPLLRLTVNAFLNHPGIDAVRIIIHPDDTELYQISVGDLPLLDPVFGGETRQDSGYNGLKSLSEYAPDYVLIHDAARPFVSADAISRVIAALAEDVAVLAAVPVTDTIKILAAHQKFSGQNLTDDAAIAEADGHVVRLVEGNEDNFKVTAADDFERAAHRLGYDQEGAVADIRVGSGFDVHRFGAGEAVILCGVSIPHSHGLLGHSDADVGLHAITDAILGAISADDIGAYFPPSETQWKNADSAIFLAKAAELVRDKDARISHIDVTLICEEPKIGPHRDAMRARVAEILELSTDRVSVKATTTEKLGFTGRGEGIAAQATATIQL
jgi:2-C-methyl-D-erythritol 4-phosphate cytidylyltransferase/2-C-methyl-D-erythritol 2,4-cyclodiphosphate synthase